MISITDFFNFKRFLTKSKVESVDSKPVNDYMVWKGSKDFGVIEYVFSIDEHHFFTFVSLSEMPILRYLESVKLNDICKLKINDKQLRSQIDIIYNKIENGKLGDSLLLVDQLKKQMDYVFDPISIIQLASVIYFTEHEDLTRYDQGYNKHKIDLFVKKNTLDHWLKEPFRDLIPYVFQYDTDLISYLQAQIQINKQLITTMLKMSDIQSHQMTSLTSVLEQVEQLEMSTSLM